jgi:hypothetical protein
LKEELKYWFPIYEEISIDILSKTVTGIVVPDKYGKSDPTIFDCLFGIRRF